MDAFNITGPAAISSPILFSIPHCGTRVPGDILPEYKAELLPPDDTDWYVDQLYAFAQEMGITVISAVYSRWVIDLNRNPDNAPLYHDGRIITDLCPCTDFLGRPIYHDERRQVRPEERERRKRLYYNPYHQKLQELLLATKVKFGKVLLWDCHSIRRLVPTISPHPFPDLLLGTADGLSAPATIVSAAMDALSSGEFEVRQDYLFKGGYITRHFGQPEQQQYALQLEMPKELYMKAGETEYDAARARKVQQVLRQTFTALTTILHASTP
ncbi:N-formylglutamate amidohydrolase [Botryobacter ruber]|uniref:N-formylglutamate amidohydrolase n=1 Tax=Botryobacter ruber TaxID=2171629 RepID=UPI000E09E2A3|nr:N-formylglutamate amidohydrolase [Botryobacter ruber]